MANIEINDLNEEITISEDEIKHVNGGAGYIKIGDIAGESRLKANTLRPGGLLGQSKQIPYP